MAIRFVTYRMTINTCNRTNVVFWDATFPGDSDQTPVHLNCLKPHNSNYASKNNSHPAIKDLFGGGLVTSSAIKGLLLNRIYTLCTYYPTVI